MNRLILGKEQYYSLDDRRTKLNNNVLVVGAAGTGKTRGLVVPNLLEASGSYVVSDPKGNLYDKYGAYLKNKGYKVDKLDFTDISDSVSYNFFRYIKNEQDILKIAHMIVNKDDRGRDNKDPFWDDTSELLMVALVAYLIEQYEPEERTLQNVLKLCEMMFFDEDHCMAKNPVDLLFEALEQQDRDSFAVSQYKKFRIAADRTLKSIVISLNSKIAVYQAVARNMEYDTVDIGSLGTRKRALFVTVSDSDRSLDGLANMFFTQAMNELCRVADKETKDYRLPIPVRFILDDFATNCTILDFPRMISSVRSRGISVMLMIQAESQLMRSYGEDYRTIIGNCDSYVYMGGNDVETAKMVAMRSDMPVKKILNMPVSTNWIFRRGQAPINGTVIDLDEYVAENHIRLIRHYRRTERQ